MPFNGTGGFTRLYSWVNDAAANIKIRADRMDNEMNGMATGLSTCITKDGQTTVTANLPMAGFRHTGVGSASSRTDYTRLDQSQDGKLAWAAAGGTADAITAAYSIPLTALVDGQLCYVRALGANTTTTPTFSPNGLTARTIVKEGGEALSVGDISAAGQELILRYNLANTRWELLNPAQPASPAAVPYTAASAAGAASIALAEDTDNGTNTMTFKAPDSLASNIVVTGPSSTGTVATLAGTETLTNKTLQSITSIDFGGGALSTYIPPTSFTPTMAGTTTAGAGTYTTQTGWYSRIGDLVYFSINLTWTAHTGTGNIKLTGLPVTSSANNGNVQASINAFNLVITAGYRAAPVITPGSTDVTIIGEPIGSTGGVNIGIAMDTAATINVTGFYRA